jgi:hypothetical protein
MSRPANLELNLGYGETSSRPPRTNYYQDHTLYIEIEKGLGESGADWWKSAADALRPLL